MMTQEQVSDALLMSNKALAVAQELTQFASSKAFPEQADLRSAFARAAETLLEAVMQCEGVVMSVRPVGDRRQGEKAEGGIK